MPALRYYKNSKTLQTKLCIIYLSSSTLELWKFSNLTFRDEDAHKAFLENFSRRGIYSECLVIVASPKGIYSECWVILVDFVDIDLPNVIHSQG